MDVREHFEITTTALGRWLRAQLLDCVFVGLMWLVGLWIIGIPWAPLWAVVGAILQFIPNFGPMIALIFPVAVATVAKGLMGLLYVLILYAIIVVIDGLLLQPYLMRRTARVPIWASIFTPIVLGMLLGTIGLGFVGVLIAAPLLAIVYTYRNRRKRTMRRGEPEILPPERPPARF